MWDIATSSAYHLPGVCATKPCGRPADSLDGSSLTRFNDNTDNVRLMKIWLQHRSREKTQAAVAQRFLPSRLLDVNAFPKNGDLRLVASSDISAAAIPPYLALSHCWGGDVPVKLLQDNTKRWTEEGISFKVLPKTFQDAVQITRQLGIRYLWIDSMCIIQDFKEDWKREAALMAGVYGNAYCTLAALSSKNSREGCRTNTNIQASLRNPYTEIEHGAFKTHSGEFRASRLRIFSKMPRTWIEEFNGQTSSSGGETDSPLRTRAWVLQEKELSKCTIYFGKNQLLWENGLRKGTSQIPWEEVKPQKRSQTPRMMRLNPRSQLEPYPGSPWYDLIEDYSSRSLSFPSDKLVAFSGLARKFGDDKKQYLAGVWSTDLPAGLLWRVVGAPASRPAYLAPSWSWASLMGSVTYDSLRLMPDQDSAQYEHAEDIYPGLRMLRFHTPHMTLEDPKKPYGDVLEGRLTLSGARCIAVDCGSGSVRFADGGHALLHKKKKIGLFYPDIEHEHIPSKETFFLALHSESISALTRHEFRLQQDRQMISMVMGIVITKVSSKKGGYRRVGLARWVDEQLFDTVQTTTVEIV